MTRRLLADIKVDYRDLRPLVKQSHGKVGADRRLAGPALFIPDHNDTRAQKQPLTRKSVLSQGLNKARSSSVVLASRLLTAQERAPIRDPNIAATTYRTSPLVVSQP